MGILFTSIVAFVATNIDDLFLLALFFGNRRYPVSSIVAGQLTGISALIGISLAGSLTGNFINVQYIGLLGVLPIYFGIKQFFSHNENGEDHAVELNSSSVVLGVAVVTIANGGDNIGIYIPLFVSLTAINKIIMVVTFLFMTVLWCTLGRYLSRHKLLQRAIEQYGHIATPVVLILLGLYIMYESNTFALVF